MYMPNDVHVLAGTIYMSSHTKGIGDVVAAVGVCAKDRILMNDNHCYKHGYNHI
jgi:hypothetical protein